MTFLFMVERWKMCFSDPVISSSDEYFHRIKQHHWKNATRSFQYTQAGRSPAVESQKKGISQDDIVQIDGRRNNPVLLNTSPIQEASKL